MSGGLIISRDAESDLRIAVQAPFGLAWLRSEVGSPADESRVKLLCPAQITHAKIEYGASENKIHRPIIAAGPAKSTRYGRHPFSAGSMQCHSHGGSGLADDVFEVVAPRFRG